MINAPLSPFLGRYHHDDLSAPKTAALGRVTKALEFLGLSPTSYKVMKSPRNYVQFNVVELIS